MYSGLNREEAISSVKLVYLEIGWRVKYLEILFLWNENRSLASGLELIWFTVMIFNDHKVSIKSQTSIEESFCCVLDVKNNLKSFCLSTMYNVI